MNLYEKNVYKQLDDWHKDILKQSGLFEKVSKNIQTRTQRVIPQKVQNTVTAAIEKMTQAILVGSGLLTIQEDTSGLSLGERDFLVTECFERYKKTAVAQGVTLGAGGVLLGLADLPTLMSIKVKFLFDTAKLYGYDTQDKNERLFILHIFQLAFSSREHRLETFDTLEHWDELDHNAIDWEKFQLEYRDYIDIAKLLQLLPLVGSVAGGTANYKLMHRLKVNAMNCYRMRILGRKWKE